MNLKKELICFLETSGWLGLEDEENAKRVVNTYLRTFKPVIASVLIDIDLSKHTVNERTKKDRRNKFAANSSKQLIDSRISWLVRSQKQSLDDSKLYDIHIHWLKPHNRVDHDNITGVIKNILDGIQKSGLLNEDTPKYIWNISHSFEVHGETELWCRVDFYENEG